MTASKHKINSFFRKTLNFKFSRSSKILIAVLAMLLLLAISEILFVLNTAPYYVSNFYLRRAVNFAQKSDTQKAANSLLKAAEIEIKYQSNKYDNLIPENYTRNINFSNYGSGFENKYIDYISNLDLNLKKIEDIKLAKIFYDLAMLAHEEGEEDITIPFLQTAVYIEPELSHYHVELANYYLVLNKRDKSADALKYCLNFEYPVKHCQDYRSGSFSANHPEEVGFLEKELEKYYAGI